MTKKKILIVEDVNLVALDIQESLQASDYEVVGVTASGKEALDLVQSKRPNLVLMDIHLGGDVDGAETALAIRSRFGVPVIFLTAFTDSATLDRARLAQPYGYIVKPFQDRELFANIEIALYKHEQETLFLRNGNWLENTLSAFKDGIILIDRYKNVVFLNDRAAESTGWPRGTGAPIDKVFIIYEEKAGSIISEVTTDSLMNEALSKNITINFMGEIFLLGKDGHKTHIDGSITPIVASDGSTLGAVLFFLELESQKTSPGDREVKPENILELSEDGNISSFGLGAERIFGFKPSEIVGKNIGTLLPNPFYSFIHKNGSIHPIFDAVNKMRVKERSAFIALLLRKLSPNPQNKNTDNSKEIHR